MIRERERRLTQSFNMTHFTKNGRKKLSSRYDQYNYQSFNDYRKEKTFWIKDCVGHVM